MSLSEIVRVCGGDLYSSGRRASIPGPGHSRSDRSASLLIGKTGRVVAYSFGRSTVWEILDQLRGQGLIDPAGFPTATSHLSDAAPGISNQQRRLVALDLWSHGVPIAGTPSDRYLSQRSLRISAFPDARLLHHPHCPYSVYDTRSRAGPALMALIQAPDGSPTAVELTYLDALGRRHTRLRLSRKTVGVVPPGAYVELSRISRHIVVGEGVVTTLSAMTILGLPGRAMLGARNLPSMLVPADSVEITIAADRGAVGEAAASQLQRKLIGLDVQARVQLPVEPFEDFNQMLGAEVLGKR